VQRKKKEAHSGAIVWRGGECSVSFVVEPG
jgi:hypothetical protein